jgi:hypothetical protein
MRRPGLADKLLSCADFRIRRFEFRCGGFPRGLSHVPKPSYEVDHLDKEYKGRNGTPGSVSKPDGFGSRFAERASATETLDQ